MAKSILNVVMQGASGKIGKMLVFRQTRNGETVIAIRGKKRSTPPTAKEQAVRERFREAAYTAKMLVKDPIYGPRYLAIAKEQGKTAYIIAMKDCLTNPKINLVRVNGNNSEVGEAIVVRDIEDFNVASVRVNILKANYTVIEQGFATVENNNLLDRVYLTRSKIASYSGSNVNVSANNIHGNETVKTVTINKFSPIKRARDIKINFMSLKGVSGLHYARPLRTRHGVKQSPAGLDTEWRHKYQSLESPSRAALKTCA